MDMVNLIVKCSSGQPRCRLGPGCVKMATMPDVSLKFARVRTGGRTLWHVQQGRRFIGPIAEIGDGSEAPRLFDGIPRT